RGLDLLACILGDADAAATRELFERIRGVEQLTAVWQTRARAGAVKRVQRTIARLHDGGGEAEDDKGQSEGQGEGEPENDEEEEEEDVDDLVGRKLERCLASFYLPAKRGVG
ncbi:hypothetical protein OC834_007867, partial [Tilletia horrida]